MTKKLILSSVILAACAQVYAERTTPNIIFILVDDMGYGDVSALNRDSKIRTPHLDRMIDNGVSFSDAHTSSSVSTPTRYGVLTGRYNWRSRLKKGVLNGYSKALIPEDRTTMASLLKKKNYETGCVGKWHLGWNWNFKNNPTDLNSMDAYEGKGEIDYNQPIKQGPTALGFDYFYGFSGSLDMAPYVYIENDKVTALPDRETVNTGMGFWRKGPTGSNFIHEETLPHLTDQAISFISKKANKENPFFLYLPLPAPHTPILPMGKWVGKSGLNAYGDFVMMVDNEVGRILNTLNELDIDENTLVVFTSDNGCSPQAKFEELHQKEHYPSYIYRGMKADLFEGGHRVPCVVQWKGALQRGESSQTICLTDFFATFADIVDINLQDHEGEDSYSLLKALKNPKLEKPIRKATIHHSITGEFAIRKGDWKLLVSPSSGGWSEPRPNNKAALKSLPPMQLYNLKNDLVEKNNLYNNEPDKVKELHEILKKQILDGRSTPGAKQDNDKGDNWEQLNVIFN